MEEECVCKLRSLMDRIFLGNHELCPDEYENILNCFKEPPNSTSKIPISEDPILINILSHCIINGQNVSIRNEIFLFDIIATVLENELQFIKLQSIDLIFSKLKNMVNNILTSDNCSLALHSACIHFLRSAMCHKTGLISLFKSEVWENVLQRHNINRPKVAHTSYEFMASFVWKLAEFELEKDLNTVAQFLIALIMNNAFTKNEVFDIELDKLNSESVVMPLHVLNLIIEDTYRFVHFKPMHDLLYRISSLNYIYVRIISGSRDSNLISLLMKITLKSNMSRCIVRYKNEGKPSNEFLKNVLALFRNFASSVVAEKRMVTILMELSYELYSVWVTTNYPSTFVRNGLEFEIETQFLMILTMPMLLCSNNQLELAEENSIVKIFGVNNVSLMTEPITHCFYEMRKLVCADNKINYSCIIQNLTYVLNLQPIVKPKHAGILFQNLYLVLVPYFPIEEDDKLVIKHNQLKCFESIKILSLAVEALKKLLLGHKIHWYEVVDVLNLPANLMNLINTNVLPPKQMLQVLDLLNVAIQKFLSPDMTLLIEGKQDSSLSRMAVALKSYITHEDWEVRDSALTIVLTCTDLAFVSYTPLQKLLTENKLVILALGAAFLDENQYVQCTALKCLKAAIKVDCLWKDVLDCDEHIYTKLLNMFQHNPEEMIQIEAAKVLINTFINQKLPQHFVINMHKAMALVALQESYWELQITVLDFWEHTIQFKLTSIGMLDGTFPAYTFSKVKRKIIKLSPEEIRRQLTSFMEDLAAIGCLTVLYYSLNECSNEEVFKKAYKISSGIVTILKDHNCEIESKDTNEMCTVQSDSINEIIEQMDVTLGLNIKEDSDKYTDQVIDEILNTSFNDLILNLPVQTQGLSPGFETNVVLKDVMLYQISPAQFLNYYIFLDYTKILEEKVQNVFCKSHNLNKLLDDLLK